MRAAATFAGRLRETGLLPAVSWVQVELYGSLGHTGRGHGTDKAVMLGLEGELPDQVDPDSIDARLAVIAEKRSLSLGRAARRGRRL